MKNIFLFLLFGTFIAFGQGGGSLNNNQDKSILPNVTPPSPESFKFTEYGKNGVSEFTGKVNLNVPIYNYTVGQIVLPINLNYSGAGVKVNDISSLVGTNWILNTGGVINRKINDAADEGLHATRKYIDYNQMINNATINCQPYSQYYAELADAGDIYDTEIDEWSFNFNGYSGSFYLDENFNPIYIENENEIKIEIIGTGTTNLQKLRNSYIFVITTPDGLKYYFGGTECEKTMMFSGHRGNSFLENSSFFLYKIADPLGNEILLEYHTDESALLHFDKSYQMTSAGGGITQYNIPSYTTTGLSNQINNPKFLKKIKNNKTTEEVVFNINTYDNFHYLASLQNIEVYSNDTMIKKVELTYDFPTNITFQYNSVLPASRFFLKKVEINKSLLNVNGKYDVYEFEYDNSNLMPVRLSPSQDALGYFNNENNHTTIPKPSYFANTTSDSFGELHPNFEYAKRGSLAKVIYPTKGFSTFEYEPIKAKTKIFDFYSLHSEGSSIAQIPGDNGIAEDPVSFEGVYEDQQVIFNIFTGISDIEGEDSEMIYQMFHNCRAELKILDVTTNTFVTLWKFLGMEPNKSIFKYNLKKDHLYQFTFKINFLNNTSTYMQYVNANAEFEIFNGYEVVNGFGVRLKSQKDYVNSSSFSNYKRYFYKEINTVGDDLYRLSEIELSPKMTLTYNPNSIIDTYIYSPTIPSNPGDNAPNMFGYFINLFSESSNVYSNASYVETFDVVTISDGGDYFENGGTEKYFLKKRNESNNKIVVTDDGCFNNSFEDDIICGYVDETNTGKTIVRKHAFTNEVTKQGYFNGKLLLERNFINKNNSIFKNKEVYYDYTFERKQLNNAVNFIGRDLYEINTPLNFCPDNPSVLIRALSDFFMAYYFIETFEVKLKNIISKEYIEPVPLNLNVPLFVGVDQDFNEDFPSHDINFKKITTTQSFEYGTLKGLPTIIATNTSDSAIVNKTVNTYVNTASTLLNIPTNQIAIYNSLISENRVSAPVQVQQYQNTELLSTQRTLFKSWFISEEQPNKILPEKIQTAKGDLTVNPLEDKAIFYNYDEHFNPVVVGYKDAPKTRYMFNTEGLVVAKIENYTGTSTTFPLITGNVDNTNCALQTQYPNSNVTVFTYNLVTKKLVQITDSRCQNSFYVYDDLHRLKLIKDHDENIVKEFDQQFKN